MDHSDPTASPYGLAVVNGPAGKGVVTLRDIPADADVIPFEGDIVPWNAVPAADIIYVMMSDTGNWVIPRTMARFINHSCVPNLRFDARRMLVATRAIHAGEELTVSYNVLELFETERRRLHPDWYFWDARWSFDCVCGEPHCQGRIDGYVPRGAVSGLSA